MIESDEEGGFLEELSEDEREDGHQLDEDVERGARGVLERVAHSVADHSRSVGGGVLLLEHAVGVSDAGGYAVSQLISYLRCTSWRCPRHRPRWRS